MAMPPRDPAGALEFLRSQGESTPHGGVDISLYEDRVRRLKALQALERPAMIIIRGEQYGLRIFDRRNATSADYVVRVTDAYVIGEESIFGDNGNHAWLAHDIVTEITKLPNKKLRPIILSATTEVIMIYDDHEGWRIEYRLRTFRA